MKNNTAPSHKQAQKYVQIIYNKIYLERRYHIRPCLQS